MSSDGDKEGIRGEKNHVVGKVEEHGHEQPVVQGDPEAVHADEPGIDPSKPALVEMATAK